MKLKLIIFHALGISVIFAALLTELFMLYDIAITGYFRAVEKNPVILSVEFILLFFGILYAIHLLKVIKTLFIEESSEKDKNY